MRKVFYVKKNPAMPMSNDNWIEMNSFEFEQFIHTPEGHERRYNFGRLDACSEDDAIIYIECGVEKAKEWESEIIRRKYIQKVKKACDVTVCSYSSLISDDYPFKTYSGEQYLEDTDYDLEEIVMKNLDLERLHDALKTLSQEQMDLICALYLRDEPMSVSQYASVLGISKNAVQCRKNVILKKLRKIMDAEA